VKLAINVVLSLAMLAICLWLVWPSAGEWSDIKRSFRRLELAEIWPYLAAHVVLVIVTTFFRAWRWNNLLMPIGVRLSPARLLAISAVGFMAIMALPARLGEFVRPALIRKKGEISASAALGTVAVERIIDGLLVSVFVFGAFFALRGPNSPDWMMITAYSALGVFLAATIFLAFALKRPEETVEFAIKLSMLRLVSLRVADVISAKLLDMIRGFTVLEDRKNLAVFVFWSLLYWLANGLSLWLLAPAFEIDLSLVGAYATMGLIAVGITLPNSPGLVGQYQWLVQLGLSLYVGQEVADNQGFLFAVAVHAIQVVWYVGAGLVALSSRHVSFQEVAQARHLTEDPE
jgi:uncharacterized protein (TIRG00374 family)